MNNRSNLINRNNSNSNEARSDGNYLDNFSDEQPQTRMNQANMEIRSGRSLDDMYVNRPEQNL